MTATPPPIQKLAGLAAMAATFFLLAAPVWSAFGTIAGAEALLNDARATNGVLAARAASERASLAQNKRIYARSLGDFDMAAVSAKLQEQCAAALQAFRDLEIREGCALSQSPGQGGLYQHTIAFTVAGEAPLVLRGLSDTEIGGAALADLRLSAEAGEPRKLILHMRFIDVSDAPQEPGS